MLDIKKIIDENEASINGKKVLYIRSRDDSKRLLIVMSTHNQGGNYLALRTFLENQFCDLLFIADPENSWYLDNDYGESFFKTIKKFSETYSSDSIFLLGSSMSGYGALLHGLRLNANVIAINPQVNLDVTKKYSWDELTDHIEGIKGKHINIDEHAFNMWRDSVVYVLHGHYPMDTMNVDLLMTSAPARKKVILQTLDVDSHAYPFGRDVVYLKKIIDLIAAYRNLPDVFEFENILNTSDFKPLRTQRHWRGVNSLKHPLQSFSDKYLWQMRHSFEDEGALIFFTNIGFYKNKKPIGGLCLFDGGSWKYLAPVPDESNCLIKNDQIKFDSDYKNCSNQQLISNDWLVRKDDSSSLNIEGSIDSVKIVFKSGSGALAFLHKSIKIDDEDLDDLVGKMITFSADVYSDQGGVMLVAGGYGENGYHHSNSKPSIKGRWNTISASVIYPTINKTHHDAIFVRINFGADKKDKNVIIRNMKIFIGYFPDDLKI